MDEQRVREIVREELEKLLEGKETAAVGAAAIKSAIENGEMTINQARQQAGLLPIDNPDADKKLTKA